MNIRNALTVISMMLVSLCSVDAGEVRTWKPEELLERSAIVVSGRPTQIMATGEKATIRFGNRKEGREIPIEFFTAKVQVVKVIKGEVIGKELTLRYSKVDYTRIPAPVHVQRIQLKEDVLYLLYLNPTKNGVFVGALESEFHQRQAARELEPENIEDAALETPE